MNTIITFVKNWTLPLGIVLGFIGFPVLWHLNFLVPYLIFTMLLLTFSKIPLSNLKFSTFHFLMVAVQLVGSVAVYAALRPVNIIIAEAAMVIIMTPTGTATAVVTQKLGGNAASLTSYMILSNLATAITAPLLFPFIHPMTAGIGFWAAFFFILQKVFPLLILPFIMAMVIRHFVPPLGQRLAKWQEWAFYLWGITLMIVIAKTIHTLVTEPNDGMMAFSLMISAAVICFVLFTCGKWVGSFFDERVTAGQAMGQKNAILAAWLSQTYLSPITAVAASSYIVWQNAFNAWQLWRQRRRTERESLLKSEEKAL